MGETYDASRIQVLRGLEAVRRRPAMYIGDVGVRGFHHLLYEVVDNAVDEALAGYCDRIEVQILTNTTISVEDNGRGIPVDLHPTQHRPGVEVILTTLHAGAKFEGKVYPIAGGLHGVGVSVVNALSEWLEVEVYRDGVIYHQRYERGEPVTPLVSKGQTKKHGTRVEFKPDPLIFKKREFEWDLIAVRLRELAYLTSGINIELFDRRTQRREQYHFPGGLLEFLSYLDQGRTPIIKPVYITETRNHTQIELAFQYNDGFQENIFSYANTINTHEGGTHLAGFKAGLTRTLNEYARRNGLLKEGLELLGEDTREGLTALLSVKLPDPQFEGQTKTKLGNSELRGFVESVVVEHLTRYLEENPKETSAILAKVVGAARARVAAKKARELARRRTLIESDTLPGKLADCSSSDPKERELYIVEGDSAGGSAKQGRDRRYQAVLPLRGKILNVEKSSLNKILTNHEIRAIFSALGAGVEEDEFAPERIRYQKVIIMTDADVDGSHIRALLLTFFFRFMRPLIALGWLYIAQPPLYRVAIPGSKGVRYLYSEEELEALSGGRREKFEVQRYKGLGEMNPDELFKTTMDPEHRVLKRVMLEDAAEAAQIFQVLMGDEVERRREFIEENARKVENLDI